MCTIMIQRETLPAEKRSRKASQEAVDKLMAYDKLLSEPFTRNELHKLFFHGGWRGKEDQYSVLTDAEKQIVDAWKLKAQVSIDEPEKVVGGESVFKRATSSIPTIYKPLNYGGSDISDYRRYLKASLNETPSFDGNVWGCRSNNTGKIYVWLDNMCFGNSNKKGFYYVRWYNLYIILRLSDSSCSLWREWVFSLVGAKGEEQLLDRFPKLCYGNMCVIPVDHGKTHGRCSMILV